MAEATAKTPLTTYQWKLFAFLGVATFFEGYDFLALTQILPNLRAEMGITVVHAGLLVGFINVGSIVAYFLIRKADAWGRKRLLTITIVGYTIFTSRSDEHPLQLRRARRHQRQLLHLPRRRGDHGRVANRGVGALMGLASPFDMAAVMEEASCPVPYGGSQPAGGDVSRAQYATSSPSSRLPE
jgi:hypothetical protein